VLTTVPMWFGLTDQDKTEFTIQQLADADQQTDWGMRIISNRSALYNGSGYHFGSVWPLFTGWASVGQYRYHQAFPAYANLRANALLALDGSLGHVAEVLSGDYYQPLSTNSPHQIWSAAMVMSPILRGMLGLETDAQDHTVRFSPHVPAEWRSFTVERVAAGSAVLDFEYQRTLGTIALEVRRKGSGDCTLVFAPALSLRTEVASVELNGRSLPFYVTANAADQHVSMQFPLTQETSTVRIRLKNDFGVSLSDVLPPLGSKSQGLRVLNETWNSNHTQVTLELSGVPGHMYQLSLLGSSQITSIHGARFLRDAGGDQGTLEVNFLSGNSESYVHQNVVLDFAKPK